MLFTSRFMGKRYLFILILSSLSCWNAWAINMPACYYGMAHFHDDDNEHLLRRFKQLGPFTRLRVMAKKPKFFGDQSSLDEPITLSVDKNQANHLYNFILSLWPKPEMSQLSKILENVRASNISDREFISTLKETRVWLKKLRSAAIALSSNHEASEDLDRLIIVMGKIKDFVEIKKNDEAASYLKEFKKLFSLKSRELIEKDIQKFNPNSKAEFAQWLSAGLKEVRLRLREPDIKPSRLHELRKFVGQLANLFSAMHALDPDPEFHNYYWFLISLDSRMGDFNDELIKRDVHKRVEIPKDIRSDLEELVPNLNVEG
jgi:hypothetical protein